jgi:hypothetical protein
MSRGPGTREDVIRRQEADLEAMSSRGSARIARLDVAERTKRALLAEAVENRIFALQQDLLELAQNNGPYSAAKVVAQQIQLAQSQYRELVSGDPSDMLRAYESLAASSSSSAGSSSSSSDENNDVDADDYH